MYGEGRRGPHAPTRPSPLPRPSLLTRDRVTRRSSGCPWPLSEGPPCGGQVALAIEGHIRGVAATTSRQSPGQRGGGRKRLKKKGKSNDNVPLLCQVAQSAARRCLAAFCVLPVVGSHARQEIGNHDNQTPVQQVCASGRPEMKK